MKWVQRNSGCWQGCSTCGIDWCAITEIVDDFADGHTEAYYYLALLVGCRYPSAAGAKAAAERIEKALEEEK